MRRWSEMLCVCVLSAGLLGGCTLLDRIRQIGDAPPLNPMSDPTLAEDYQPVTLPMPTPVVAQRNPNSLWRTGSRGFFKDLRAKQIGDIVTVLIDISDNADISNKTVQNRQSSEQGGTGRLLGLESLYSKVLPEAVRPGELLEIDSQTGVTGEGTISREEKIKVKVAAVITQVLPNGNLVLYGRQETRVNFEVRELHIAGIIRPEDISSSNDVPYDKIAEARVAYGGRGQITNLQQPRWGNQLVDIFFPF